MWRAFFLAIGLYSIILGVECLAVERVVLRARAPVTMDTPLALEAQSIVASHRVIAPPDWAPFSLMGLGSVVVLYSFTVPRRARGK